MLKNITIGKAAALSGLPSDTLRFYERSGLLNPGRTRGGRRVYRDRDLLLLRFVARMRATDMPVDEIRRYLTLASAGDSTLAERRGILEAHAERVRARLAACEEALSTIEFKLAHFDAVHRGELPGGSACSTKRPERRPPAREAAAGGQRL